MRNCIILLVIGLLLSSCSTSQVEPSQNNKWSFVVLSDTHVTGNSTVVTEMIPFIIKDSADLVLITGDLVQGGKRADAEVLRAEFDLWKECFKPLIDKGTKLYPVRGNHEDDAIDDIAVWNEVFSGTLQLPQNGSNGEKNLSYSFTHNNAFFVGLDVYTNIHKVNQLWLDEQFSSNHSQHKFVFAHEAAFKAFHSDCLDDYVNERDIFWKSMSKAGVKSYFCGHDHFYDVTQIDDGDGNQSNDIYQFIVGGGGGWLMSKYNYNGENSSFIPKQIDHKQENGYLLVTVDGGEVTMTWKGRVETNGKVEYQAGSDIISYSK